MTIAVIEAVAAVVLFIGWTVVMRRLVNAVEAWLARRRRHPVLREERDGRLIADHSLGRHLRRKMQR